MVAAEAIEAWTSNNRLQFALSPSGFLIIVEQDQAEARATVLLDSEPLELLDFLTKHQADLQQRLQSMSMDADRARQKARYRAWCIENGEL
jgi:hypothetical protein